MIPGGIPTDPKVLLAKANEWIEQCRISVGMRASYYRTMNSLAETGRYDGTKALINMLHKALDETASHLFSPVELKFSINFGRKYPKRYYQMATEAAGGVTRVWQNNSTDVTFGRGVFESLKYGACLLKQWPQEEGSDQHIVYYDKLVMPWNFGVYREDENRIDRQEMLCETVQLTGPEVWRRIWRMPKSEELYRRIMTHAKRGETLGEPNSFFHQVLSASQINTGVQGMTMPLPGGIVQLNSDPNYALMGPVVGADLVQMHELWIKDEDDYTTIQLIEPDILVTPHNDGKIIFKKQNLLGKDSQLQPYRLIQPNEVTGWFWGRSELVDLIEPQALLSQWCDDLRRMFGLQVDKILFFIGENGITDELYGQMRGAGYGNLPQGGDVKDMTPKIPPEALQLLEWIQAQINVLRGFPPIMQGQGEPGVRAGSHADMLLKTATPTLQDRALIVERQCAEAADLTASLRELKEESFYWSEGDTLEKIEESKFLLSDMPSDWHVTVDSHSSSPIFADKNTQLVFAAHKMGTVDDEYVIDNTPLPNKEVAKVAARERAKNQKELVQGVMKSNPELGAKIIEKSLTGGKHH